MMKIYNPLGFKDDFKNSNTFRSRIVNHFSALFKYRTEEMTLRNSVNPFLFLSVLNNN
jgi:hypothetical protein